MSVACRSGAGPHHASWPTSISRRAQRGQALIEFCMFFLFIMLLVAGVTDIGTLLDDHVDIVYAARQGARTGAVLGPVAGADCAIVNAVYASLQNQPNLTPTQVTIYDADANGANTLGKEVVYNEPVRCNPGPPASFYNPSTGLGVAATTNTWPETSRVNTLYFEQSLGVQINYLYQFRFYLLGSGQFSGADAAIFPIGPTSSS